MMCKLEPGLCLKNKHDGAALVQAEKRAWQERKNLTAWEVSQINKYQ